MKYHGHEKLKSSGTGIHTYKRKHYYISGIRHQVPQPQYLQGLWHFFSFKWSKTRLYLISQCLFFQLLRYSIISPCYASTNGSDCVTVPANRDYISNCIPKIHGFKECLQRLGYRIIACIWKSPSQLLHITYSIFSKIKKRWCAFHHCFRDSNRHYGIICEKTFVSHQVIPRLLFIISKLKSRPCNITYDCA